MIEIKDDIRIIEDEFYNCPVCGEQLYTIHEELDTPLGIASSASYLSPVSQKHLDEHSKKEYARAFAKENR